MFSKFSKCGVKRIWIYVDSVQTSIDFILFLGVPRAHVVLQTHQGALVGQAVLLHPLQLPRRAQGQRTAARQEGKKSIINIPLNDCVTATSEFTQPEPSFLFISVEC